MNYFEFYKLPVRFFLDKKELKRLFLTYSKQYHPDFYTQDSEAEQERVLELSTINNQAYKTLSNLDSRIKYVLEIKGLLTEGERYQLSPDFLMEMMDINEQLMDLQFEADKTVIGALQKEVGDLTQNLFSEVEELLKNYENKPEQEKKLEKIKEYYYKKRYLLRIQKSLNKLAI